MFEAERMQDSHMAGTVSPPREQERRDLEALIALARRRLEPVPST